MVIIGELLLNKSILLFALRHALTVSNDAVTKLTINSIKNNIQQLSDGDVALLICEIELVNNTDEIWIELKNILLKYLYEYESNIIN